MPTFTMDDDSVYLMGIYDNEYQYGSNPPPSTNAVFIARYAFDGQRIWFREFTLGNTIASGKGLLTVTHGDELVALLNGSYPLRLDKEDGSVLE